MLKNFVKASNIFIGDYTYFDDRRHGPDKFEEYNVLYNYDFSKVKLVIGKLGGVPAIDTLLNWKLSGNLDLRFDGGRRGDDSHGRVEKPSKKGEQSSGYKL